MRTETDDDLASPSANPWPERDSNPGNPAKSGRVYRGIVWWGGLLVRAYHRIEIVGPAVPDSAPVLLVQNHSNGLCDAHILMCTTDRPIRLLVKYKLITAPVLGWMLRQMNAVPVYRQKDGVDTRKNAESFNAINESLREDSIIALFPEGESLNSIGLRKLRSGVGRMALSGEQSTPGGIGLQIVPVGVTYEDRDRMRALASTVIGDPIDVATILAETEGENDRARIRAILAKTSEGMRALILQADTPEEHATAVALERLLPQHGPPLGIRRQAALRALRMDAPGRALGKAPGRAPDEASDEASEWSAGRHAAVLDLGERFASVRLTGDDVLAPAPTLGATYGPLALWLPVLLLCLPFWAPLALFALFISRFPKSPDKVVTLRVLFGYLGLILMIPVTATVGALLGGWVGAAIGLAAFWAATQAFTPALDGCLRTQQHRARRSLGRPSSELQTLQTTLRSIRDAYAGK